MREHLCTLGSFSFTLDPKAKYMPKVAALHQLRALDLEIGIGTHHDRGSVSHLRTGKLETHELAYYNPILGMIF